MNGKPDSLREKRPKSLASCRSGPLTNADVVHANGDYDQLVSSVQRRYKCERTRAQQLVNDWLSGRRKG